MYPKQKTRKAVIKGKRAASAVAPKLHQFLFPVDLATSRKMNTKFEKLFLSTSSDEEDNHSSRSSDSEAEAEHHPALGFLQELFKEAEPFQNSVVKTPLKAATKIDAAITVAPAQYQRVEKGVETKTDDEAMHLKLYMPGVGKEDVKVSVVGNTITAVGEDNGKKKPYSHTFCLPTHSFKLEETTAKMTNGVLSLVIPKIKEVMIQVN